MGWSPGSGSGAGSVIGINGPVNTTLARIFPTFSNPAAQLNGVYFNPVARGNLGVSGQGLYGLTIDARDGAGVATKAVSGCVNNGSGLIRVTCTGHGFSTGEKVVIYSVTGTTEANAAWTITVIDANTFDLQGSAFANAYISGGFATNRPFLLGLYVSLNLLAARGGIPAGATANSEDANGISIQNVGTFKGTSALDINSDPNLAGSAWGSAINIEASADWGISLTRGAAQTYANGGIDFAGTATQPVYGASGAIRLPNNVTVTSRNAANTADIILFKCNTSNWLEIDAPLNLPDGIDVVMGTTTGTHLPFAANMKMGFWGVTPIVQPNAVGSATGYAAGATAATFHSDDTYTGNVGTRAYTINGIVAALKNSGILQAS